MSKHLIHQQQNNIPYLSNRRLTSCLSPRSYMFGQLVGSWRELDFVPEFLDSVKYNAIRNYTPKKSRNAKNRKEQLLITLDWLQFNLQSTVTLSNFGIPECVEAGASFSLPPFEFVLTSNRSQNYNRIADVYLNHEGEKHAFGKLQFDSNKKFLSDCMSFKVENRLFYSADFDLHVMFDTFLCVLSSSVKNVTRADIACDGIDLDNFINKYWYHRSGLYQVKVDNINLPRGACKRGGHITAFSVGHRRGRKSAIYYDKSQEIIDNDNKKQYILDYFKTNGFDIRHHVKRFEVRFNSQYMKELKNFSYRDLFKTSNLVSLFLGSLKNFFEFIKIEDKERTGNVSRCKRVVIFPLNAFITLPKRIFARIVRKVTKATKRTKKVVAKVLFQDFLYTQGVDPIFYLGNLAENLGNFLRKNSLVKWFLKKQDYYISEFRTLYGSPPNAHLLEVPYYKDHIPIT